MDTQEPENVIFEYTDAQALEDGFLDAVNWGFVNRVTRAVFDHFARPMANLPEGGMAFDVAPLRAAVRAVLEVVPDEDGWRKTTYEGKELWLVPNEVRGLTLMFPDDWWNQNFSTVPGTVRLQPFQTPIYLQCESGE